MTKNIKSAVKNTRKITVKTLINSMAIGQLDKLHAEQVQWHDKQYKGTTDKLHSMLAGCLDVCEQLKGERGQRKLLDNALESWGYTKLATTHLTTKVVRYVFRMTGKRTDAYARVLRLATAAGVTALDFPKWVADAGGVEEVRRTRANGISSAEATKQVVKATADILLERDALASLRKAVPALAVNTNGTLDFSLALVRKNANTGAHEIVHAENNASLIAKFLAFVGKDVIEAHNKQRAGGQHKDAVAAAANALDAEIDAAVQDNSAVAVAA